ncbi:MAG TPA: osmotically inducible lipoprotein OsmB, partial [Delftia acidovorans]|nr:osmotically inducible lipoprotein OsmB [Delftia acidovorans]
MKTRLYSIAAAAAIALFSAGCSTNPSSAQIGTGVGAVAGGVVGDALFGSDAAAAAAA